MPTYKFRISYGPETISALMYMAARLPNMEAGVNLVHYFLIPNKLRNRMKLNRLLTLYTATKPPLSLDGLILQHLRLGDFNTRIWFWMAPNLSVDIELGASFIYHFKSGNFPPKRKFTSWHSEVVSIPNLNVKRMDGPAVKNYDK